MPRADLIEALAIAQRGLRRDDTLVLGDGRSARIDDLVERRPDLLIVDRNSGYFEQANFDWLAFMAEDPAWAAAFAPYRRIHETERLIFFLRDPEREKTPP